MSKPPPPLLQYEKNYTSQFGEDGILERALELLPALDRWCVEFGAWDGKYLSNTYSLIEKHEYSGVMIEADPEKFVELNQTYASRTNIITLNKLVEFAGKNSLDNLLSAHPIPKNFDVLSMDIDGNDYHVWDSLKNYRPKIVVIEYNPTIPNEVDFVQPKDMRVSQGSSLAALYRLARAKGYRLIHATTVNGIFVDEIYFPCFGIDDDDPALLRANLSPITHFFQTFDGQIHIAGNPTMLWHDIPIDPAQLQVLPKWLRTYPLLFTKIQQLGWKAYCQYRKLRGRPQKSS